MLIVTGPARSYTSLTMQILESFGLPIVGDKYIDPEQLKKYNPEGIYEVENIVINGVREDKYRFEVIKLVLGALYPSRINGHTGTHSSYLRNARAIWCLRDPREVAESVFRMDKVTEITPAYYHYEVSGFLFWLDSNRWFIDNLVLLDTKELFSKPRETICALAEICGVSNKEHIEAAIARIKPRKQKTIHWPQKYIKTGEYVDEIHRLLVAQDIDSAIFLAKERILRPFELFNNNSV